MRLYRIKDDGKFTEYKEQKFKTEHSEKTLESWLESNPDSIVEDGALFIIGRQVATAFGSYIDLLALDKNGNTAVVELKRDRTPRDTLAQAFEYASFVEGLEYEQLEQLLRSYTGNEAESLSESHKAYFKLEEGEGVSFNKDQRIVIIGYGISEQIRQTASFLRKKGLTTTCIEFNYFQTESGEQLMSHNIVVGNEPLLGRRISTESLPKVTKKQFLDSLDQSGREVFNAIFKLAEENDMPIHWGSRGFSLNVDVEGTHVALCLGYPPNSTPQQSIYTGFYSVSDKVQDGENIVKIFKERFARTGLFVPIGSHDDMKILIQKSIPEEKITEIVDIISDLARNIQKNGAKE
jgi:hypothetical protein